MKKLYQYLVLTVLALQISIGSLEAASTSKAASASTEEGVMQVRIDYAKPGSIGEFGKLAERVVAGEATETHLSISSWNSGNVRMLTSLSPEIMILVADMVRSGHLEGLEFSSMIGDEEARVLGHALTDEASKLRVLVMGDALMGGADAILGEALGRNRSLVLLAISFLWDEDSYSKKAFFSGLQRNDTLRFLCMSCRCNVSYKDLDGYIDELKAGNRPLEMMTTRPFASGQDTRERVEEACEKNVSDRRAHQASTRRTFARRRGAVLRRRWAVLEEYSKKCGGRHLVDEDDRGYMFAGTNSFSERDLAFLRSLNPLLAGYLTFPKAFFERFPDASDPDILQYFKG